MHYALVVMASTDTTTVVVVVVLENASKYQRLEIQYFSTIFAANPRLRDPWIVNLRRGIVETRWGGRFSDVGLACAAQPKAPDTIGHAPVTILTPSRPPAVLQAPILQTVFLTICAQHARYVRISECQQQLVPSPFRPRRHTRACDSARH